MNKEVCVEEKLICNVEFLKKLGELKIRKEIDSYSGPRIRGKGIIIQYEELGYKEDCTWILGPSNDLKEKVINKINSIFVALRIPYKAEEEGLDELSISKYGRHFDKEQYKYIEKEKYFDKKQKRFRYIHKYERYVDEYGNKERIINWILENRNMIGEDILSKIGINPQLYQKVYKTEDSYIPMKEGSVIGILEYTDEKEKEKIERIKMQERRAMREK